MQSESINELASALAKAQGEINSAVKNKVNPFHKNKYADLDSIRKACKEPLSNNGLALSQVIEHDNGSDFLDTFLLHSSGQWIKSRCRIVTKDGSPQQFGSSLTYMLRYSLAALVGISSEEDDDAEGAEGRKDTNQPAKTQPEAPKSVLPPDRIAYIKKAFLSAPDSIKANISSFLSKHSLTLDTLSEQAAARVEEALKL